MYPFYRYPKFDLHLNMAMKGEICPTDNGGLY